MIRRDMHSNIKTVSHIIGTVSATQTPANGVDLSGFQTSEFVIHIGTVTNAGSGKWSFKLQESDSVSSGFTDVKDTNVVLTESAASPVTAPDSSTGEFLLVDHADEDDAVYRVGYIGYKRFVRVVATAADTPGDTALSVVAVLGGPSIAPTSD